MVVVVAGGEVGNGASVVAIEIVVVVDAVVVGAAVVVDEVPAHAANTSAMAAIAVSPL
ncbi:MAG: hypothetical protein QNJ88_08450 [Acidimicrobiia bacterium]|nr:hypothetical protein [Acidimicrobiia bacterium]